MDNNHQLLEGEALRNRHFRQVLLSAPDLLHMNCGHVNVYSCDSLQDIVIIAKNNMLNNLLGMNISEQYERLLRTDFHIHNTTLEQIRNTPNLPVYLCKEPHQDG